jgi:hypothetical protein
VKILTVALVALLLAGCGGSGNHDPRKGRVVTTDSNCFTGSCVYDWKVCIGPDLLIHISDATPADHTVRDSQECRP